MDLDDALSYAAERQRGVLITLKADGRPQASNINFDVKDGVVRISVTAGRAKVRNATRDPRVSLHVTSDDFWSYVVIDGDAELSPVVQAVDDPAMEPLIDLYRSVQGEHPDWDDYRAAMVRDRRQVLHLHPTHAYGSLPQG